MLTSTHPPLESTRHQGDEAWRVAWTRGGQSRQLAEVLGGDLAQSVGADLTRSCIDGRIDILVARRLISFDLVPVAVAHGLDLSRVRFITAAVAGGPHTDLTAAVASRLAGRLAVPATIATVFRPHDDQDMARHRLEVLSALHPNLVPEAVDGTGATSLAHLLDDGTLLVLGAPGGSWLQRQLFGPGSRMSLTAPGGAVVVRNAPRRCFHRAMSPAGVAVGPHLRVADALRVLCHPTTPVAAAGRLVGIVRMSALEAAPPDLGVGDIMEPPVWVDAVEAEAALDELAPFFEGGPIPVVDRSGQLVGAVPPGGR